MFYLMLILLLYRFYSNCDLSDFNPSVVPAIYWYMYIYYLHTDYFFSILKKRQLKITIESLCLHNVSTYSK